MIETKSFQIGAVSKPKQNKNNKIFVSVKVGVEDNAPWLYCDESALFPHFEKGKTITAIIDTYKDFQKITDVVTGETKEPIKVGTAKAQLDRLEGKIDELLEIAHLRNPE